MDQIQHKFLDINGLKLHVAELGTGDTVVVFLHGFPEVWYSWRHQMIGVSQAGYRTIALDFRGYGLSEIPPEPEKTTYKDLVDDVVGILDQLGIPKVFAVGNDFGSQVAYDFAMLNPSRVSGLVTFGMPFVPMVLVDQIFISVPEGNYIMRWSIPGKAEADFGRFDIKTVVKKIYILFSKSDMPIAEENQEIMDLVDSSEPLPSWFTEEDLSNLASLYEKSGFHAALTIPYRSMLIDYGETVPNVSAPALLIAGESDYAVKFPGIEQYVKRGMAKQFVPNLDVIFVEDGSHFVHEQFPAQSPGRAEADFGRFDVKTVIKKIYILFSKSAVPIAEEDQEVMDLADSSDPLPSWFTEEDLSNYATLYEKSGFLTPLTLPYRALPTDFGEIVPNVSAPALFIMGGSDYFLKFPGVEEYVTSGTVKQFVPNLEVKFVDNGSHFVQEQFPEQVNEHIINFLGKHA